MKKQLMAGLIGAAAMLAMGATGAQAMKALGYTFPVGTNCTINKIGAGYVLPDGYRTATITCTGGDADWLAVTPALTNVPTTFSIHEGHDKDGQLAALLTAYAVGGKLFDCQTYIGPGGTPKFLVSVTLK